MSNAGVTVEERRHIDTRSLMAETQHCAWVTLSHHGTIETSIGPACHLPSLKRAAPFATTSRGHYTAAGQLLHRERKTNGLREHQRRYKLGKEGREAHRDVEAAALNEVHCQW